MNKLNIIKVSLKKYCSLFIKTGRQYFFNLPLWLWCSIVLLSIFKIWLVAGQHISAIGYNIHDDRLFINLAENIIHFHWLGDYGQFTLMKGPFYPMWIAFSYFIHIPLFFSQHFLYIFACTILTIALRPLFKKPWLLFVIFAIILFNPVSFTDGPATQVIREGIYPALTILVIALFVGALLRIKNSLKKILLWSLGSGIALSCFWLTREEGPWIIPFAILISCYSAFIIFKEKSKQCKIKIVLIFLPFLLLFFSIKLISVINYYNYGVFNTVEFNETAFLNAYGALTRVKGPIWMADVPVSVAQRQTIYSISPTFSKLKPFLEEELGKGWAKFRVQSVDPIGADEIQGGWFMWAFRDAVSSAGYYSNGKTAMHFYSQIAYEINFACDSKKISCYSRRSSMMPPWNKNYAMPTINSIYQGLSYVINLDGYNAKPSLSVGDELSLKLFSKITQEPVSATENENKFKVLILNNISRAYAFISPIATVLALFIFLFQLINIKKSYKNLKFIICISIAASFFARIVGLALINATSFPVINNIVYPSPLYPLLFLFILLNFLMFSDHN